MEKSYYTRELGLKSGTVRLFPYQLAWNELFEDETRQLRLALHNPSLQIEHIGSTAIEGMDAKPLIDMMVATERIEIARCLIPIVEQLGYKYKRDDPIPERLFFAKGPAHLRTHHLSFSEPTSLYWKNQLLFRDYLRTHPAVAEAYKRLKIDLASQFPADRSAYTCGKEVFITRVLQQASKRSHDNI